MPFCTAIDCMDGRVQEPVIRFLKQRFDVEYVDSITEAGPVRLLAGDTGTPEVTSILRRVEISVEKHGSRRIAMIAHHDCAGNPVDEQTQREQLAAATAFLRLQYPQTEVIGLWVDSDWTVHEV